VLNDAYDSLGALIADPTNITTGFQVPATLATGSVTVSWSSSEPGVLGFGTTVTNNLINVTVNRPKKGDGDAPLNVIADLSIPAQLTTGNLTRRWTQAVTVKQSTVDEVVINNVADILALTDPGLDRNLNVTLDDMTIFAKSGGEAFAYDGTGVIQIYRGAADSLVVGKVYTISGLIDWYFGIWEIVNSLATEDTTATPQYPTKEVINEINAKITQLNTDGEAGKAFGNASGGNFEAIYARVTGRVAVIDGLPGNYNTYILDTEFPVTSFVSGTGTDATNVVPATGLLVYYQTVDYALLKEYNGLVVTIDVVIFTFRSDYRAFAVYYVGGPTGIEANLSPEQKQTIDLAALSVPSSITEATTISLPTTGLNGSTVSWSSSNEAVINSTTGAVTIPDPAAVVTLTASVTIETLAAKTRTFEVAVGALEVSTMQQLLDLPLNSIAYSEGEVMWVNSTSKSFILADETGYGFIFVASALPALTNVKVGDFIGVNYKVGLFNGLPQMTEPKILVPTGTRPTIATPTATVMTATEINAFLALPRYAPNYVTVNDLVGYTSGNFTNGYLPGIGSAFVQTNGASNDLRGKKFNTTGWIIGRGAGTPAASMTIQGMTYSDATLAPNATEQERLAIALDRYAAIAPRPNAELKQNVILPAVNSVAEIGATIAWTSSNTAVLSNTGVVTRPASGSPDVNVKLSYVLTVGTLSSTAVEIDFTVLAVIPGELLTVTAAYTGATTTMSATLNNANLIGLDSTLFTVASAKNSASTEVGLNTAGRMVLYANTAAGNGTSLTITIGTGYSIKAVEIVFGASTNSATTRVTLGTEVINLTSVQSLNATQSYADRSITSFSLQNTQVGGSAGQVFILSIKITYQQVIA
jgi:hypothetical protein